MRPTKSKHKKTLSSALLASTTGIAFASSLLGAQQARAEDHAQSHDTATPIKHVIIVVGENRTFDNLYGTYQPKHGQKIDNLLSKQIVTADGKPGKRFDLAKQYVGSDTTTYMVETPSTSAYDVLPQPYTTSAIGQPAAVLDTRFPVDLPNGPYQITKYVPYAAYTGDPVHRFFQMWQQYDGGKLDKFVWVEATIGTGSNGKPVPEGGFNPKEGAISMGFFNMNPYTDAAGNPSAGDAPVFKALADQYAISDNYHQAVMGGTGANFQAIVSGDAAFFTNTNLDGTAAVPFSNQIEDPDPVAGTNNYYTQDGYSGGSYVHCADPTQPGVAAVNAELEKQGVKDSKCEAGHYYLLNNYDMYWDQTSASPRTLGPDSFTLPPQSIPTIADVMTEHNVSWKYYSSDRGDDATSYPTSVNGIDIPFHSYCGICDPLTGYSSIMKAPSEEAKLQNYGAFVRDLDAGELPAVSFLRPFEAFAAHPADSNTSLYEQFLSDLIEQVKSQPDIWSSTAILITTDEGGGYYDSGYIQPVDFFGDGTRIPLVVVSPFAKQGFVDHTYYDHVSLLKFIEKNWHLPPVSKRSRDNLPNPVTCGSDRYRPINGPAIGDLMHLFSFGHDHGNGNGNGDGDHGHN